MIFEVHGCLCQVLNWHAIAVLPFQQGRDQAVQRFTRSFCVTE